MYATLQELDDNSEYHQDVWLNSADFSAAHGISDLKSQLDIKPTIIEHTRTAGTMQGGEDFLTLLERPLLFQDVQQLMAFGPMVNDQNDPNFTGGHSPSDHSGMSESPSYTVLGSAQQGVQDLSMDAGKTIYRSTSYSGQSDDGSTKSRFGSMSDSEVNEVTGIRTSAEIVAAQLEAYSMSNGESSDDGEDHSMPGSPHSSSSSSSSNCTTTMFELDDLVEKEILEIAQLQTGCCDEEVAQCGTVKSENRGGRQGGQHRRRCQHLWEFIIEVIRDPRYNPSLICWIERERGIFKIVKSQEVAKLWGQRKHNATMSYEYMSRAMRHYYKNGILKRVSGKRLVYQFGPKAYGWEDVSHA